MELRIVMEELLARTTGIEPKPGEVPVNAAYPASGFVNLPIVMR